METEEQLDAIFFALSDSRRRMLLAELAVGPKSVNQLALTGGMKLSAASKHIAALEVARLLYKTRHGREVYCQLNVDVWRAVASYIAMHEKFWAGRLDELEAHLKETGKE
jgi:DNA-binding transcriptional ArsR family regulator